LWLVLEDAPFGKSDTALARVFLFFALCVWPGYLPGSLLLIEKTRARRAVLGALSVGGTALGLYLMACASLRKSDACIAFSNLYYWVQIDMSFRRLAPYAYAAFIVAPLVVSSLRGTSPLAAAAVLSFALTGWLYDGAGFVSVWCFFAAVLSGIVAAIVRVSPAWARAQHDVNRARSI
jgi:hypothetical protein